MKTSRYGIVSLQKQFPDDGACLQFIFDALYRRRCSCKGEFKRISGRRQFQCSKCRFQIAPAAGTIFHKSETSLVLWFHAILAFLNAKGGISAKQLERDLEISYKCAWRILGLIRRILDDVPHLYTRGLSYSDVVAIVIKADSGPRRRKRKKFRGVYLA
ncbi:MAG TPA: IS1595 family transposase [Candidatus Paceibacterota bacterium]|nr:IS1595 family transposase [Candidatus Paceibacterota bacterium]